jgi:hypothetical protein
VQTGRLPSLRFSSPSASPRTRQQLWWPGLPRPTACVLRFSRPLDAFIRREPAGLVSCRIRSWGCALQSVPPLVQPYAVSGADPLLPLAAPFGTEPSARLPLPKQRPSRRTGHSSQIAETTLEPQAFQPPKWLSSPKTNRATACRRNGLPKTWFARHHPTYQSTSGIRRTTIRASGSAPDFRGLLHTRVRHSISGGLDRRPARSSLGLSALQGCLPRWRAPAFTGAPLMGFPHAGANDRVTGPPGFHPQRVRLDSLETADPHGLCRLMTITNVWVGRGSGVTSSGSGVRHRPLASHL